MTKFSIALDAVLLDKVARRKSWPANQYVYLALGRMGYNLAGQPFYHHVPAHLFYQNGDKDVSVRMPSLMLSFNDGANMRGWQPNTLDLLAHDWEIAEDAGGLSNVRTFEVDDWADRSGRVGVIARISDKLAARRRTG